MPTKRKKKERPDELRDFAVMLARMKVRAGELGLYETMQALEVPVKKIGWELAAKKQAEMTLRADVEIERGHYNGFRVRRVSDNFVVFWGTGPLGKPNPIQEWKDLLRFLKKTTHGKFVVGQSVKKFVKGNKKLEWSEDGKAIQARRKSK